MPALFIADCNVGRGLFAAERIAAGAEILRFEGPELTLREVRAKGDAAANTLQIGVNRYLDLAEPGRLVNHSCDPNAGIRDAVRLIALQNIEPGEEIRFDYSTTISDGWTMPCLCASRRCRGLVTAFQLLPAELQQRYAMLRIVQPFILSDREA
jgi:hypothetical protein